MNALANPTIILTSPASFDLVLASSLPVKRSFAWSSRHSSTLLFDSQQPRVMAADVRMPRVTHCTAVLGLPHATVPPPPGTAVLRHR